MVDPAWSKIMLKEKSATLSIIKSGKDIHSTFSSQESYFQIRRPVVINKTDRSRLVRTDLHRKHVLEIAVRCEGPNLHHPTATCQTNLEVILIFHVFEEVNVGNFSRTHSSDLNFMKRPLNNNRILIIYHLGWINSLFRRSTARSSNSPPKCQCTVYLEHRTGR